MSREGTAQDIDWRKAAAAAALGAASLSSGPGFAAAKRRSVSKPKEQERGPSLTDLAKTLGLDEYDLIEAMLGAGFGISGRQFDTHALDMLVADFALKHPKEGEDENPLVSEMFAGLWLRHLHPVHAPPTTLTGWDLVEDPSAQPEEMSFEFHGIERRDGRRSAIIARLLRRRTSKKEQDSDDLIVKNMLRNTDLASADGGPFLRILAQSHTVDSAAKEPGAEVMLMMEPFSATFGQYIQSYGVSLPKRLALFHSVIVGVDRLQSKNILHNSYINLDTVLITGDLSRASSTSAVLCPSIFAANLKADVPGGRMRKKLTGNSARPGHARSRDEMVSYDLRQLGFLLHALLAGPNGCSYERLHPLQDLADNMKSGDSGPEASKAKALGEDSEFPIFDAFVAASALGAAWEEEVMKLEGQDSGRRCELGNVEAWEALYSSASASAHTGGRGAETAKFLKKVSEAATLGRQLAEQRGSEILVGEALQSLMLAAGFE